MALGFYERGTSGLSERLLASQEDLVPYSCMVGYMNMNLIHLTQERAQWRALVNNVIKLSAHIKEGFF
jgi:hypothetical protein